MSRVFIIEPPSVNVAMAESFGKLIVLFKDGLKISPLDSDFYAGAIIEALEEVDYDPKVDLICVVGPLSSMWVVGAALCTRFGPFQSLIFNGSRGQYVRRTVGKWKYTKKWKED